MDIATTCPPLLAQCITIMKALERVRGYLRSVPVTLTALATECFLLHQALTTIQRRILDTAEETGLLESLDALFIGCKITLSAIEDSANHMYQAMSVSSDLETPEPSAPRYPRSHQLWEEEHMKQFQLQLSAYRLSIPGHFAGDMMQASNSMLTLRS
jgi:hypothetical protein